MPEGIDSLDQVSHRIRLMRKSGRISQSRLAHACGLSQSTIARMERDIKRLNPSYSTVYLVVETLIGMGRKAGDGEILRKRAYEVMHRKIAYVGPRDTIANAISLFTDHGFQQLPVLDPDKKVVGTVYEKDLLSIATQSPEMIRRRIVASVMKAPLPQIDKETEIMKVKPMLESWDAVIVSEKGKAIGIVTIYDILKNV